MTQDAGTGQYQGVIPFVGQSYTGFSKNLNGQRCVNWFVEYDQSGKQGLALYPTPGLQSEFTVGNGTIGALSFSGAVGGNVLIAASDNEIYSVNSGGTATKLGDVGGPGRVQIERSTDRVVIVSGGSSPVKTWDGSSFANGDSDVDGASHVGFVNQRFVFIAEGRLWWSEVGSTSVLSTNFALVEGTPSPAQALIVNHGQVWVFCGDSTEVFYDTGNANGTFARISGAFMEVGILARYSVAKFGGAVYWVGQDQWGGRHVYRASRYSPEIISTPAIDHQLLEAGELNDISAKNAPFAYTYSERGHDFYVFTIPTANQTWVYDITTNQWHERSSRVDGISGRHRSNCFAYRHTQDFGTNIRQIGNSLEISDVTNPALARLNDTDVAYIDSTNDQLRTYRWDGSDWAQVGNGLSITVSSGVAVAGLNSTDIALSTGAFLRTYRWNGSDWAQVGNSLTITGVGFPSLAGLSATDVAYVDTVNTDLRTYRWDGEDWAQVGNDLNISFSGFACITALNSTDIAYIDDDNGDLRTYRFDGADWAQVGNDLNISGVVAPAVESLNATDIAYFDIGNDELRLYRFDGSDWSAIGNALAITVTGSQYAAIAALNSTTVACIDPANDELATFIFEATGGSGEFSDKNLVGDYASNAVYSMSMDYASENGLEIKRIRDGAYVHKDRMPVITNSVEIEFETGNAGAISIATASSIAATTLNSTDIAYIDETNDRLTTYRWDGRDWRKVGAALSISGVGPPSLATLNSTDVAFVDSFLDRLTTYRWNGETWNQVGNILSFNMGAPAITALNSTDIAFIDSTNDQLRTYRWSGTTWAQVGNSLSITGVLAPTLTTLDSTHIAFVDRTVQSLRTYEWDGTDWTLGGNALAVTVSGNPKIEALGSTNIAYVDAAGSLKTYEWDGTDWSLAGSTNIGSAGNRGLTALNSTDVAYIDSTSDALKTYRWDGSAWLQIGNSYRGAPVAILEWSDDNGRTWRGGQAKSLGTTGDYAKRLKWNRLRQSRARIYRVTVEDSIKTAVVGAYANMEV